MIFPLYVIGALLVFGIVLRYQRQARQEAAQLHVTIRRLGTTLPKNHVWDLGEITDGFGNGVED